jgi:hypothetical protein
VISVRQQLWLPAQFIDRPEPYTPSPSRARRRYVLRGAAIGLAVAIVARVWMRALTDQTPKFSIPGTGLIFVVVAGLGACAGLAFAWRRLASPRRLLVQRLVGLAPLLLMGPFMFLFIPGTLTAWTLAHRHWRRWLRIGLFAVAGLAGAFLLLAFAGRGGQQGALSLLLYFPVAYAMFLTNRIVFEPRSRTAVSTATPDLYEPWLG